MTGIDRRSALAVGFYLAGTTALLAQGDQGTESPGDPRRENQPGEFPGPDTGAGTLRRTDETIAHYWNRALRDLNAFDHSFVARPRLPRETDGTDEDERRRQQEEREDARQQIRALVRAPGPVASARAMGLAHAVLADAMFAASPEKRYELWNQEVEDVETASLAMFVGGAVSAIARHIYSSREHYHVLAPCAQKESRRRPAWELRRKGRELLPSYK